MAIEGVMVSYNHSSDVEPAKILTVSSSGIKFSDRWVLAHGSLIAPLKEAEFIHKSNGKIINDELYAKLPEIYVTCEKKPSEIIYEEVKQLSRDRDPGNLVDLEHHSYLVRVLTGRICHIWQCPVIDRCASAIMHSWAVGLHDAPVEQQGTIGKTLLSLFVLIDLETDHRGYKVLRPLSALLDMVTPPPNRGSKLEVHSTPFGCEVFLNTVSRGGVSLLIGPLPSLLLTDAPTAMGSEGGPVFTDDADKRLIGMVICSVSWWRGEWVGLSLLAPLSTVLTAKLNVRPSISPSPKINYPPSILLESIDNSTVQVRCGSSWGTGVYLGRGYILTCAHVVRNYELYKVMVYCQRQKEIAIVRYKTVEERAYDLALLFTNPQPWARLRPARLAAAPATKGEPVLAAGFSYFTDDDVEDLLPIVTNGHVSNVSPSLLQTTCCIQAGFSGGPILRVSEEQLVEVVGIITCNAKTTAGATHSHLNMSIPVNLFHDVLQQYQRDKDISRLEVMNNNQEMIQSQWRLLPYRSKI